MSETDSAFTRNETLADQINAEVLRDPNHPYRGKYVGLANGRLVCVGDDPDDVIEQLDKVESDPMKCYCFEAGIDYSQVEEIWSPF